MILIRPLTAQDEPFLWEMLYQAIYVPEGQASPPRSILDEPELAHYVSGWGQRPKDMGYLAVEQSTEQPIGAAWLRLFSKTDQGYGFVDEETPELSIAVLPNYRGKGAGTLLMTAILKAARENFCAISLSVSSDNPAARLYHRLGFVVVSESGNSMTMRKLTA